MIWKGKSMATKGGIKILQNNWSGNRKSFLKNLPVKAGVNGVKTSRNKECKVDGQHHHLRCKIITALNTHHQQSSHLKGLSYKKLWVLVCI